MGMLSYTSSVCVSFSLCLAFSDTIFFLCREETMQTHTHVQWDTSPGVRRLQQASQIISTALGPPTCGWKVFPLWPVDCLWFLPAHLSICLPVFCVYFFFLLFFLMLLGLHTCWFAHLLHLLSFCFFLSVWTCWYVSLSQISLSVAWGENLLYSIPTVTKCCHICDFLQYLDSWYLKWFKLLTQKFIFVLCGGHDSETCRSSTFYAVWLISSVLSRGQPELSGNATLVVV